MVRKCNFLFKYCIALCLLFKYCIALCFALFINHNDSDCVTIHSYFGYSYKFETDDIKHNHGKINLFVPVIYNDNIVLFADIDKKFFNHDKSYDSIGVGYRAEINDKNIFGINSHISSQENSFGNDFHQVSLGLELMSRLYEVRFNASKNTNNKSITKISAVNPDLERITTITPYDKYEFEIGLKPNDSIGVYAGFLQYKNDNKSINGQRIRIENVFDLNERTQIISNGFYDHYDKSDFGFKNNFGFEMNFRISLGSDGGSRKNNLSSSAHTNLSSSKYTLSSSDECTHESEQTFNHASLLGDCKSRREYGGSTENNFHSLANNNVSNISTGGFPDFAENDSISHLSSSNVLLAKHSGDPLSNSNSLNNNDVSNIGTSGFPNSSKYESENDNTALTSSSEDDNTEYAQEWRISNTSSKNNSSDQKFHELLFKPVMKDHFIRSDYSVEYVSITDGKIDTLLELLQKVPFTAYFHNDHSRVMTGELIDQKDFNKLVLINSNDPMLDINAIQNKINGIGSNILILLDTADKNGNLPATQTIFTINNNLTLQNGSYLVGDGYQFDVKLQTPKEQCLNICTVNETRAPFNPENPPSIINVENINLQNPFITMHNSNGIVGTNINFNSATVGTQADLLDRNKKNYWILMKDLANSTAIANTTQINIQDNTFTNNVANTTIIEAKNDCFSTSGPIVPCNLQTTFLPNKIKLYGNAFIQNADETIGINTDEVTKIALKHNSFVSNFPNTDGVNFDTFAPVNTNYFTRNGNDIIPQLYNGNGEGNLFTNNSNSEDVGFISFENFGGAPMTSYSGISNFKWNNFSKDKLTLLRYGTPNSFTIGSFVSNSANQNTFVVVTQGAFNSKALNDSQKKMVVQQQITSGSSSATQANFASGLAMLSMNSSQPKVNIDATYKGQPARFKWHDVGINWDLENSIGPNSDGTCTNFDNATSVFDYNNTKKSIIQLGVDNVISGFDIIYYERFQPNTTGDTNGATSCDVPQTCNAGTGQCNINLPPLQSLTPPATLNEAFIVDVTDSSAAIQNSTISIDIGDQNISFMHFGSGVTVNPEFSNNEFNVGLKNGGLVYNFDGNAGNQVSDEAALNGQGNVVNERVIP